MNYIDTRVLHSRINPYRFFLETWDVNLDKDEASKHAMEAVEDFPNEVIDELLDTGIAGWYSAPEYAPLEVASDPVEASLAAVGYSWFPGGTQQGNSAVYVIGTDVVLSAALAADDVRKEGISPYILWFFCCTVANMVDEDPELEGFRVHFKINDRNLADACSDHPEMFHRKNGETYARGEAYVPFEPSCGIRRLDDILRWATLDDEYAKEVRLYNRMQTLMHTVWVLPATGADLSPKFFLEAPDLPLDADRKIAYVLDFPKNLIEDMIKEGIAGEFGAPEGAPPEVARNPVNAALAALGYDWYSRTE